ncbi:MAG: DUF4918 family protein [Ignavibacterium sp.]|nr:MAG: DUF4918 family protein [Ignavibacterium sp.]
MSTFADKAIKYFLSLESPTGLTENIIAINPYKKPEVQTAVKQFFNKYFNDSKNRLFVYGINPGRFGGGLTGIAFTDPVALREDCGIKINLGTRKELSSKFIYNLISEFGGPHKFFSKIYLTALYPLAILKNDKNYNYYDKPDLYKALKRYIENSIIEQLEFGASKDFAISLGQKNAKFLKEINNEYNFFNEIRVLNHPRYIMQYKLKQMNKYLKEYLSAMNN